MLHTSAKSALQLHGLNAEPGVSHTVFNVLMFEVDKAVVSSSINIHLGGKFYGLLV